MTWLLGDALDEPGLDRQFGGGQRQRLLGDLDRHAVDLEQDASRLDAGDPQFGSALSRTHPHFQRLLRYRHVWKHPNPDPSRALHMTRERAPRRLDLACGDALRLDRLEPV